VQTGLLDVFFEHGNWELGDHKRWGICWVSVCRKGCVLHGIG